VWSESTLDERKPNRMIGEFVKKLWQEKEGSAFSL
jgi:hypothetical protein